MELQAQLMKTVTIVDDCWIRGIEGDPEEYSHIRLGGILYHAHIVSYELFVGPVFLGNDVCHKCDRPRCINPEHLFQGTTKENVQDAIQKGRFHYGERSGSAVLTETDVLIMRQMYKEGATNYTHLGELFGVSAHNVKAVVTYQTWKHLS